MRHEARRRGRATHPSSLIPHHSCLITHPSSLITHHSSLIPHHSSLITHPSSLITHHSCLLVVLHHRVIVDHFHHLHHAASFVAEDVAVQNVFADEVDEAAADLQVSRRD